MLNTQQADVIDRVFEGRNVFVTGPAGTGKSYLIKHLSDRLDQSKRQYTLVAPTGIAALNVGGRTIHSFFGLTPGINSLREYKNYWRNQTQKQKPRIKALDLLIIDEVSMFHPDLFSLVSQICQMYRMNQRAFGGIQVMFIGDFLQLCPIHPGRIPPPIKYVFQSPLWNQMEISGTLLNQIMRQSDATFASALNDLRVGQRTTAVTAMIQRCSRNTPDPGKVYTNLCALNRDLTAGNMAELKKIDSRPMTYHARDRGDKKLLKNCIADTELVLKVGATVMLLWNKMDHGLCNGSIGKVVGLRGHQVQVQFNDGPCIWIGPELWKIKKTVTKVPSSVGETDTSAGPTKDSDNDDSDNEDFDNDDSDNDDSDNEQSIRPVYASRSQIPLTLAWYITVHKSQSMSIDRLIVSCDWMFAEGQLYVALSRARTMEGLIIKKYRSKSLLTCPIALEFYAQMS